MNVFKIKNKFYCNKKVGSLNIGGYMCNYFID